MVSGRVLDESTRPISGARVFNAGENGAYDEELARSSDDGTFAFPLSKMSQSHVLVRARGRASQRVRVSRRGTAIGDLVLVRGRALTGRVRGPDGKPLAGATVTVTDMLVTRPYLENASPSSSQISLNVHGTSHVRLPGTAHEVSVTNAGGIFVLQGCLGQAMTVQVSAPGYRAHTVEPVSATTPLDVTLSREAPKTRVATPSSRGPSARVERRAAPAPAMVDSEVRLRVRAQCAGSPVTAFRAAVVWSRKKDDMDTTRLWSLFRKPSNAIDGVAEIVSTNRHAHNSPFLLIEAEGYARKFVHEVPETGAMDELTVSLEPEARLRGTVLHATTGKPLAGVRVWAVAKTDKAIEKYEHETKFSGLGVGVRLGPGHSTSAANGSFDLRGLAAGELCVFAHHTAWGLLPLHTVKMGKAEDRTGFRFAVPIHRVRGKLVGAPIDPRHAVRLKRHAGGGWSSAWASDYSGCVAVAKDGTFEFPQVVEGTWELQLVCPMPPRSGAPRKVEIARLEVKADIDRGFNIRDTAMTTISGHIEMANDMVPLDRLLVVSESAGYAGNSFYGYLRLTGTYALVGIDGRFELPSPGGSRHVLLLDAQTGVVLGRTAEPLTANTAEQAPLRMQCEAFPVDIEVKGATSALHLEMRVPSDNFPWGIGTIARRPMTGNHDFGIGAAIPTGAKKMRAYLPAGETEIWVRASRRNGDILGRGSVTPKPGQVTQVQIDLSK